MKENPQYILKINGENVGINFDDDDGDSKLVERTIRSMEEALDELRKPAKNLHIKSHNRMRNSRETRDMIGRRDIRRKILERHLEILRGERDGTLTYENKNGSITGLKVSENPK